MLGGHVKVVFTIVTVIFVICVSVTLNSFPEMPLWKLEIQPQKTYEQSNEENMEIDPVAHNEEAVVTETDKLQVVDSSNPISKTTSYGALKNESTTDSLRNV